MDIGLIQGFIADAKQACRDCNAALSLPGPEPELVRLQQAARSGAVERRGRVAEAGRVYEYRVHGSGYSFRDILSGKEIHFDVVPVEGVARMRFSAPSVLRYLTSVGDVLPSEVVRAELNALGTQTVELKRVTDAGFDYYLWMGE